MPISGPASYVPTLNQFIPHWGDVNTTLGASGPLVLPGPVTLADLIGFRDSLAGFALSIGGKINDVQIAKEVIELAKAIQLDRLSEFNRKVRGFLNHTPYAKALPLVPSASAGQATILEALDDMATLWPKINAATIPGFTGPLLLLGGYPVATFLTDLAILKTAYATLQEAQQDLDLERERRGEVELKAYPAMRDYRAAVAGTFATGDPLVLSLPRLSPEPGSTPDPVIASAVWDAVLLKARITWTASIAADLDHYEVRMCTGPDYSTENESVIASISPSDPRELLTDAGLATSGDVASYKVYVITTTENEAGSNAVSVTRP